MIQDRPRVSQQNAGVIEMKISYTESDKAAAGAREAQDAKILPADRPRGHVSGKKKPGEFVSPLEQGMAIAEAALAETPDVREDLVKEIKERIQKGEYAVSGEEVADMMLRRLAADRIR
jgi:flagellar biosynthesis anti-sigma factor FlgM